SRKAITDATYASGVRRWLALLAVLAAVGDSRTAGAAAPRFGPLVGVSWSSGGEIAFGAQGRGGGIFTMHGDGSGLRRIGPGVLPRWSPAGDAIAANESGELVV